MRIPLKPALTTALTLLLAAPLGLRASAADLTPEDVVQLLEAGLSPRTVMAQVDAMGTRMTLSAQQLIALKRAGADEALIQHLIRTRAAHARPEAPHAGPQRPQPAQPTEQDRQVAALHASSGPIFRRHPAVGNTMTYGLRDLGRPYDWPARSGYGGYYGYGADFGGYGGPYGYSTPVWPGYSEQPLRFYTDDSQYDYRRLMRLGPPGYFQPLHPLHD